MSGATPRFRATQLAVVLAHQGRKRRWLAEEIGVSESMMSKVLSGDRTLSDALANRVADALNMPLFLLFELHERSEKESRTERTA